MTAPAGWFPDPGGQPGMYRYWDGRAWSASLSPTPQTPPPTASAAPPPRQPAPSVGVPPVRRRPWGWIIGLAAVLLALVLVIALVVTRLTGDPSDPSGQGGQPTTQVCPSEEPEQSASPAPQPNDGRVHGGKLSYPQLPSPWSPPEPEYEVAFGRGVLLQSVETERSLNQPWVAAVMVGDLVAGDGFFTPKEGAAIVVNCVTGTFYGGSEVTRDDRRNEALKVDGHDAWLIESQLSFDVPGIQAKSELLILAVVDTGAGSAGLYYASIPENAPQLIPPARTSLAALKVDD